MKTGWLVNDYLTCIPGTKTFWHDLLNWIPNLVDKTGTDFINLPYKIESEKNYPDYLIRNATFFRKLNIPSKTISLLQDNYINSGEFKNQIDVCNNSDVVVFNSPFVHYHYSKYIKKPIETIPLGTDFDFFKKLDNKQELKEKYGFKNEPYIIYIGSSQNYPKGFDLLNKIVDNSNFNFCFVMKDDFKSNNNRIKVFNKIDHSKLLEIINCCDVCICTSQMETLHLAGVECAACGLPIVSTNVGIYYNDYSNTWGYISDTVTDFINNINKILNNYSCFDSRNSFIKKCLDKESCKKRWLDLTKMMEN